MLFKTSSLLATLFICFKSFSCSLDALNFTNNHERKRFVDFVAKVEFSSDFQNGITMWNEGEDFPSLGLGHYIWYTKDSNKKYTESFPKMLLSLYLQGFDIFQLEIAGKEIAFEIIAGKRRPLIKGDHVVINSAPWKSKADFYADKKRLKLNSQLAQQENLYRQANYQLHAFNREIELILSTYQQEIRCKITKTLEQLAKDVRAKTAMIDYINFKGNGLNPGERYQGQGWGLKQVLRKLVELEHPNSIESFIQAAKSMLDRRIRNSPPERGEHRWRRGWFNRLDLYKKI
jgi:hypothetical protein